VTQLNGDTDRPEAKFSGQTFTVVNGSSTLRSDYTVPRFGEDVLAMTDRLHEWNAVGTNGVTTNNIPLPGYLVGAEYVLIANNNRDNPNLTVTVELASPAWVYLLIDNRIGDNDAATPPDFTSLMTWVVSEGWMPVTNGLNRTSSKSVPDEVGWDENGDGSINQYGSVYRKLVTSGSVTVRQQGESRDMYGVVVASSLVETVSVTNGDPVSERPEPRFTTQNLDLVNGTSGMIYTNYTVPLFSEDAFAMTDRLHQWNGASATVPLQGYLTGNEYLAIANNYRDNATLQIGVSLRARALAYLLVDNRIGDGDASNPPNFTAVMSWVNTDGWTPVSTARNRAADPAVPDEVGYDENADGSLNQWGSVYSKILEPGTLLLGPQNEGRDMYGLVVAPALTPGAPKLALLQLGETTVRLGWSAVEQAWTYTVKRSSTAGGPYATVAESVTGSSYLDTNLTTGNTYYYVVQASNLVGAGPDSSELAATPQAAPTGLTAVGGPAQVSLSWNVMSGATAYIVKRSEVSGGPYSALSTNAAITYNDSGLPSGTRYHYVVQALFAGGGLSGDSLEATAITDGPFKVWTTETWDGIANPHAVDGVTLSGSGTDEDPFTYTIPKGMHLTSTGRINLHSAGDYSIQFVFEAGDLQMDAGAVLNIERYNIRTGKKVFVLDLGGTNSITGAGQIGPITSRDSCVRALTIKNVRNVSLANIDLHTANVNTTDPRDMTITASGAVFVSGLIDNSDQDNGGDGGWGVTIQAASIDVNNVDTRGMRNDPPGRPPYSGNVVLQALSPAGGYSTADSVNNTSANKITVRGAIRTFGVDERTMQGSVTLQAVVMQLVYGDIQVAPSGTKMLQVGVERGGASAADLFVDVSGSGQPVAYDVQWGGTFTAAGSAPVFTVKPVTRPDATQAVPYAQSLVGSATDPDAGDTLSYGKFSGPAWLQVASNGTLSGTPAVLDAGINSWQIWVTDGTRFDTATLTINVAAGPRWNDGNNDFWYPDAVQNLPYGNTLATNVIYFGSATLRYAKLSGPEWLTVGADGALSGTPAQTNVLENSWTVSVTDNLLNTNVATLRIWVNGSPKFNLDPVSRAAAFAAEDYAGRLQTLAGSAVDPQDLPMTFSKVSSSGPGPDWLAVAPDGTLSGTPAAANVGINVWTISADNGSFPATLATLTIEVKAGTLTGPVEVINAEYWDGVANPHASDGVVLSGSGTVDDPVTYTVPRGLRIYSSGAIYTSQPGVHPAETAALHIRFNIEGNMTLEATNNAFFTGVHHRNAAEGQKMLILDLQGTNSILGAGQIIGLTDNNDTPRILAITNVNDVKLASIDLLVRNANNWGRPMVIYANGAVEIGAIDNSDRDGGGDGGNDVTVFAKAIKISAIDTRSFRTSSFRNVGSISLKALATPGYSATDGANNSPANTIEVAGTLVCSTPQDATTWGGISSESVILKLESSASLVGGTDKLTLNVGKVQGTATAGDLFINHSAGTYAANYVVDWSGNTVPASPTLHIAPGAPGYLSISWTGEGFVLQQNSNLSNPSGWANAPSGTTNPATVQIGTGGLYYRLKWPQ
jgi:hypothetical protein